MIVLCIYDTLQIKLKIHSEILPNQWKKNNEIKLIPEMLNLLGCNKENFKKLIQKMNYKAFEKENNLYFKYMPIKKIIRKKEIKKDIKNNPFGVLSQLNFK